MSDNELDAELLGMVGDGSDEEGEEMDSPQDNHNRSPTPEAKESVEKTEEPQVSRKGVAQKIRARSGRKKRRAQSEDEHDFGDDGSVSPAHSLGSGAMDESDIDAPASPDEEANLYPLEGRYMNARDRDEILALPEIRREQIFAEREEQQLKKQQDLALKQVLAKSRGAPNKQNKRKAAAADLEDGGSRTTRPKAAKTTTSALDNYKRAREAKGNERTRAEPGKSRRDDRSPSSASDRDADGEEEVEYYNEPLSDRRRGDEPAPELRDFNRLKIGRTNFAKVCFYPGFEDAIRGCYARISIGPNRETGQNQYRFTLIMGFTEGKPYHMEAANGKQFVTNQYIIAAHGTAEKSWPFNFCSDSNLTDAEYDRWTATCRNENVLIPSRKKLDAKLNDLHDLLNVKWTDAAITEKLHRQKAMEKRCDPAHLAQLKKDTILKRKQAAEDSGDADEVKKCEAELAALENASMNSHTAPKPLAAKKMSEQDRLALVNQKNAGRNVEEVRRALIEEKKRLHAARAVAVEQARLKAEAQAAKKAQEVADKKRAERAKLLGDDLFGEGEGGASEGGTTPEPAKKVRSTPGLKKAHSGLGGMRKKAGMEDDIIASMDLGIDIEI